MSAVAIIEQVNIKVECDYEISGIIEDKQELDGIEVEEDPLQLKDESNEATNVQCDVCGEYCAGAQRLAAHRYTPTSDVKFTCLVCQNGSYTSKADLAKHICRKQCGNIYQTKVNTAEKDYNCDICHKGFNQKHSVTIHMRTHTGEKPYECYVCHVRFSQKGNLTTHVRTHTRAKPFVCEICRKQLTARNTLRLHMRTHTGEKPFTCDVCNKRFNQPQHLKRHMRTHTGERPYECDICHMRFAQKGNLAKHVQTHRKA